MDDTGHLPNKEEIASWPLFTKERPLELLVSGCLLGRPCGVDGSSYGAPYAHTDRLVCLPNVAMSWLFVPSGLRIRHSPTDAGHLHGGNASSMCSTARPASWSSSGEDWTEAMLGAANAMVAVAQDNGVRLALLMDISAACGSQVIYDGFRSQRIHQPGQGVCAALLIRHGIKVVSQQRITALSIWVLRRTLDPSHAPTASSRDHHETQWYVDAFGRP